MSGNKRILREFEALRPDTGLVLEGRDANGGRLFLKGPMQRASVPNQNKRIYPRELLQREFKNYVKAVTEGRASGELDHPDTSTVALERVSHVVREMWWDGDTWMGRIEILQTPCGKIAETLIDSGVMLGISSRGVGSTNTDSNGIDIVQDDFAIVAYDLVQEPSTHGAFMTEGRQMLEGTPVGSRADRINRALNALKEGRLK